MTLKIVGVIHSLEKGGAEKNFVTLFNHLATKGYNCELICFNSKQQLELSPKISVKTIKNKGLLRAPFLLLNLRKSLLESKADCIISFMDQTNILTLLSLISAKKIKTIVCERNNPAKNIILRKNSLALIERAAKVFRNLIYKNASIICTQTDGANQYFKMKFKNSIRCVAIPNFVEQAKSSTEKENIILCVSRLVPEKGLDQVIKVFSDISKNFPAWSLKIYGSGPEQEKLQELINSLGTSDKVLLAGKINNLDYEYQKASIFILNSKYEGFPNALLEAMSYGCAVVAADCDYGPREIICHEKNGLLFPVGSLDDLKNHINALINNNGYRSQLGQSASQIYLKYSQAKFEEAFEAIILNTANSPNPSLIPTQNSKY